LEATDLIEVSTIESGSYVTRSITGQELIDAIPAPTGFVPTSRTLTINGVAQDLSADRSWTIATGLTVGTTPIASGTIGRVLFEGTGNVLQQSSSLAYDDSTKAFSIVANQNATTSLTLSNNSTGSSSLITSTLISDTAVGNSLLYGSGRVNNNVNQYQTGASYIIDYQGPVSLNLSSTFASGSNSGIRFWTASSTSNGVERMRIASTGNVLINTTTDAGFRLDVNGTARVTGDFRITKSTFSSLLAFNSGAFGSSAEYFDLAYPINGGLRCIPNFSGSIDGAAFQCFGGTATSFAGQMYFDYGSNARNISGRSANWRNASLAGFTNVLTLTANSNVLINTTTDAGFRLDVNGTARVSGNLTVGDNTQIGWGNGNYIVANNATPSITLFLQSSVAATFSASGICTIPVIRTSSGGISPTTDNAQDLGGQFGRFRHGWIGGQLKVGDATAVNASAKVQVDSTTQGFLPPRMTTTQKNAIASPAAGLVVYDTTLAKLCVYTTTWETITSL
jgi:hypothetical protein